MKKIVGLSCGTKNGNCETFLRAAARGAEELGVETEIIRAMSLRVLPCMGCWGCRKTKRCVLKDDVDWILEKTCVEDCGLIVSVPCYHVRANGYFTCVNERMNHIFDRDMNILKKTRVGAIIGIGGGGYDGWASLTLPMANIFVQHTRVLVDQIQVNHCALKEWNLWAQQKEATLTSHTHQVRVQDVEYEKIWGLWSQKHDPVDFKSKALERARELGRNVARAMSLPIEEVKYVGEQSAVSCPVCHSNILLVPEDLPYVGCPVCWVRGVITVDNGKMRVEWNLEDAKNPRFSHDAIVHHLAWLGKHHGLSHQELQPTKEVINKYTSYGKIIKPPVAKKQ